MFILWSQILIFLLIFDVGSYFGATCWDAYLQHGKNNAQQMATTLWKQNDMQYEVIMDDMILTFMHLLIAIHGLKGALVGEKVGPNIIEA